MRTLTPERQSILRILEDGQARTPTEIAALLRKERTSVTQMMQKMVASGHLEQPSYGKYIKRDEP